MGWKKKKTQIEQSKRRKIYIKHKGEKLKRFKSSCPHATRWRARGRLTLLIPRKRAAEGKIFFFATAAPGTLQASLSLSLSLSFYCAVSIQCVLCFSNIIDFFPPGNTTRDPENKSTPRALCSLYIYYIHIYMLYSDAGGERVGRVLCLILLYVILIIYLYAMNKCALLFASKASEHQGRCVYMLKIRLLCISLTNITGGYCIYVDIKLCSLRNIIDPSMSKQLI